MVYKKIHNNNTSPTRNTINDGWEYKYIEGSSPWISVIAFCRYWNSHTSRSTFTASSVANNPNQSYSAKYGLGDVIICKDGDVPKHALYIVDYRDVGNGMTYVVASHTSDYVDKDLVTVANSIIGEYGNDAEFDFYYMR